jgi:beta-glucosidase/6-phospho-beta-glucosidase/beta-galactosidase
VLISWNVYQNDVSNEKACGTSIPLDRGSILYEEFPRGFRFGCGTSAVQIEGGWNADGKGPSVWDALCLEKPKAIEDGSNCFVVCDSYNEWMEDVRVLKEMGV